MPTIVLHHPTDRRAFDLFNWLRKQLPDYGFLVWDKQKSWVVSGLYPGATFLKINTLHELMVYIAARQNQTFVWLPFMEDDLDELLRRERLPVNLKLLAPSQGAFELARDKTLFTKRFMDDGLTPRLYSLQELRNHFPEQGVVSKPAVGKGAIGRQFIEKASDLSKIQEGDTIQQRVGVGKEVIGAFFLMRNGQVVRHYQHQRVRTYPPEGGVSSCAKTVFVQEVATAGEAILSALQWNGLAMLEFLQDPLSGKYLAIECNPRLWGSCLLGEFAGFGLVEDYIHLSLGKPLPERQPLKEAYIRWYFPYELLYALKSPLSRFSLFWGGQANTCFIGGTRASWFRAVLFIAASLLKAEKWLILFKKITGRR